MRAAELIILMAEDEEHDVFFARRALNAAGEGHLLYAVGDGEEAVRYLQGKGEYGDRGRYPMPNLLLTDLKMPCMDGFQLLAWLQGHPECMIVPTIVYSSSSEEEDVRRAYALGANAYFTKPSALEEMVAILRVAAAFWCRCEFPSMPARC